MLVAEYIQKLPDEQYKACRVTPTTVTLPIDAPLLSDEFSANINDTSLTAEKAVAIAATYLKTASKVTPPLDKLAAYYSVKTP